MVSDGKGMSQHIGSLKCGYSIVLDTADYRKFLRRFEAVDSVQRNCNITKTFYSDRIRLLVDRSTKRAENQNVYTENKIV
jgi:hypothetical protein